MSFTGQRLIAGQQAQCFKSHAPSLQTGRQDDGASFFTMKNSRKQYDNMAMAQPRIAISNPYVPLPDSLDELAILEDKIFAEKPMPRIPETPEDESFRAFIKNQLPQHKASPALLDRIRQSIQSTKK
jgi:hypothetical protein